MTVKAKTGRWGTTARGKNLQGDVTGAIDSVTGQLMAAFTYDAYGNVGFQPINDNNLSLISSALMFALLPQSYRGYTFSVIGEEICYYLGSRFYSPRLGRFINADKHFDTGTGVLGTNMFAYCNNNPVMYTDPTGEAAIVGTIAKILGIGVIPTAATMFYITMYNKMLCLRLFQWSFTNRHYEHTYDFSSNRLDTKNWSSFIANKLKKSQVIQAEIKSILNNMGNKKSHKEFYGNAYDKSLSFYTIISPASWAFEVDDDLAWSIGNLGDEAVFQ